jgi:hypothetical protein
VSDLAAKQATLVSGTNIRTVGGTSLLGSGDVPFGTPDVLELPIQASVPAGATDILKVFAQRRANRSVLRTIGQSGIDTSIQPALFGNTIRMWTPSSAATISVMGQAGLTAINSGTGTSISNPSIATTSNIVGMSRFSLNTGTVINSASGVRDPATYYFRGNAAGRGGWFYFCRFGVEVFNSDIQVQIGFATLSTALAGEPSAFLNCCMIGKDSTDTNWHFMHNDGAGAATKVNTTQAAAAGDIFDFFMFAPPNGTTVDFQLNNAMTGAVIATHQATTDLPANTTLMFSRASIRAPTSVTAQRLCINKVYTETDL